MVIAVDVTTGREVWRNQSQFSDSDFDSIPSCRSPLPYNDAILVVTHYGIILYDFTDSTEKCTYFAGSLKAINISTGKEEWEVQLPDDSNIYTDNFILEGDKAYWLYGNTLNVVDLKTKKLEFSGDLEVLCYSSNFSISSGRIFFIDADTTFLCENAKIVALDYKEVIIF